MSNMTQTRKERCAFCERYAEVRMLTTHKEYGVCEQCVARTLDSVLKPPRLMRIGSGDEIPLTVTWTLDD